MNSVPKRVLFLAVVFGVSSVYVSQEVGLALAEGGMPPPNGGSFSPPPGGGFQAPPQGGSFSPPPSGGNFGGSQMGMGQMPSGMQQGMQGNMQPGSQMQPGQQGMMNGMQQPGQQGQMGQMGQQGQQGSMQFGSQMQPGQMGQKGIVDPAFMPQQGQQGMQQMNDQGSQSQTQSDDQFSKQQAEQDARQQEMMKKQFTQQKKQFSQFSTMLKKFATRVAAIEKQGIAAPSELKTTLSDADVALAKILAASTMDDDGVQDAMSTLQDAGNSLQEWGQKLEQLAQFPRFIKQAASQIKKFESVSARLHKSGDATVSAQFDSTLTEVKTALQFAQTTAATGDIETANDTLQNDVFNKMDDLNSLQQKAEALKNAKKALSSFDRFITKAARNKTVADQAAEMRTRLNDLKQTLAAGSADPEDVSSAINDLFEMQNAISQQLGQNQQNFQIPTSQGQSSGGFNFQLPSLSGGSTSGQGQ